MATFEEIDEYLEAHHKEIRGISPNILNISIDTEIKNGKRTGEMAIVVWIDKKIPANRLGNPKYVIPETHGGYIVDVRELQHEGFRIGKTYVSELSPRQQRRMLGVKSVNRVAVSNKSVQTQDYEIDWRKSGKLTPVLNQEQCGSCTAFGTSGMWQDNLSILKGEIVQLSEQMLFECGGGTCSGGATPEDMLNYGINTGCALLSDCPYVSGNGIDEPCGYDLNPTWYERGKMLESFAYLSDAVAMKTALETAPIVTTLDVQQSFMNYVSGVYKPGNPATDPYVGGHEVEVVGCSDSGGYWIIKNSWGTSWGESGYVQFIYGADAIDTQMYSVILSDKTPQPLPPQPLTCTQILEKAIADIEQGNTAVGIQEAMHGLVCFIGAGGVEKEILKTEVEKLKQSIEKHL